MSSASGCILFAGGLCPHDTHLAWRDEREALRGRRDEISLERRFQLLDLIASTPPTCARAAFIQLEVLRETLRDPDAAPLPSLQLLMLGHALDQFRRILASVAAPCA